MKYIIATQLESAVAIAAPITSLPFGKITNINRGSKTIFRIAPSVIPKLAIFGCPVLLIKCASIADKMVGIPPMIMVIRVCQTA